ncbi:MAG TPA: DUF3168 domain-containing protein [Candidatus Sulfotelmatobacter sp.]|jgi:hypothetical protein
MAVKNGLFMLLSTTPSVASLIAPAPNSAPGTGIYFSLAVKQAARPYVVLHLITSSPAEKSLDGSSSLTRGRFQFDSYADDATTARQLSQAIRAFLQDFSGALPDETVVTFTHVHSDQDDAFEQGGIGYLYRSMLDIEGFYTEPLVAGTPGN